jgi:hypothetical protein
MFQPQGALLSHQLCWDLFVFVRVSNAHQVKGIVLAVPTQPSVLFLLINNNHKTSPTSLVILCLCIAIDIFQGMTLRTFAMFFIEEVGPTLIVVERITCFEANLALELTYLIFSKDLFIPSIIIFLCNDKFYR